MPANFPNPLSVLLTMLNSAQRSSETSVKDFSLPKHVFSGPSGGGDPIRLGIFAGIHGDEPAGTFAIGRFLESLTAQPELAQGYQIWLYPVCNPSGFLRRTRCCEGGLDLNREFWTNSSQPEVIWLQSEISRNRFHGIISLHSDDTSDGTYGFVSGATLSENLIEPALQAAGRYLPRNRSPRIDGFPARNGVITQGYPGVLSAPPGIDPQPFELILETPALAPQEQQELALLASLMTILEEYRKLMAYAANL